MFSWLTYSYSPDPRSRFRRLRSFFRRNRSSCEDFVGAVLIRFFRT